MVWIDFGIVNELDARKLEIDQAGRDKDAHVVAAHGPVRFRLIGLTPYDELEEFARNKGWNYGVFGFDWRRPVEESSKFFKQFIRDFRKAVIDAYGLRYDPLPNLTIVCHSMGGLVCTDALRDARFAALGFNAVLTVATPFYGTSTQQERYFAGIPGFLNKIYGAETVVRIVASLPGPYSLLFLPKSVYNRDGTKLGLRRYPEYDPNGNVDVDPFDPANLRRWPKDVRDHRAYLADARKTMENFAKPIDPSIAPRFFNVRSSLDPTTAVELLWNDVDGDTIVPGKTPSPLAGVPGPGDGTVPAWSAWHAHCRPANKHELGQAADHATLLEHPEVLAVVESIMTKRKLPAAKRGVTRVSAASDKKVADFTGAMMDAVRHKRALPPGVADKPIQRAIWRSMISGPKPKLVNKAPLSGKRRTKKF